jgi:trigger factor
MNIKNEKVNGDVQELTIEINKEDYAEKVEAALKKYRRTAQVPGFRVGNAPMAMIKKMYGKSAIYDEVNNMMSQELYKYLSDNKIDIMLEPIPVEEKSKVDFDNPDNFVFVYEYALQPQFDIDFNKQVTNFKIAASQEEIDNLINQMQRRYGEYTSPEEIGEDDYISAKIDDKDCFFFANELNEKGRKAFIGKKLNEMVHVPLRQIFEDEKNVLKVLRITDQPLEEGNQYEYDVTISSIGRITPAELNEDFFKKAYPDGSVTTKEQMEKVCAEQIERQWKDYTDRQFMNDAIGTLLDNVNINFPDEFIKRYILLTQKDMTAEKLEEKYADYQKSFKWQLIENKLVKDNELNVTQDEVKAYVRNFFMSNYFSNFKEEDIKERLDTLVNDALKKKEDVKNIYDQLYDGKIMDVLRKNFIIVEKNGSYDDFVAFASGKEAEEKPAAKKKAPAKAKKAADTAEAGEAEAKPKTRTTRAKKAETTAEGEEKPKAKTTRKSTKKEE